MEWWQTLVVAIVSIAATKGLDEITAVWRQKREFRKYRREKACSEIEELKNRIGQMYELAANWQSYDSKQPDYAKVFAADSLVVGKYNKYREIARAARDTVHLCKTVAFYEKDHRDDLVKLKQELNEQYREFIRVCQNYLDEMR